MLTTSWLSGPCGSAGNVAVIFALGAPLLAGAAAMGVETTYWSYKSLHLQEAADSAAHAGAMEQRSGGDAGRVTSVATSTATENGFDTAHETIVVNSPPASGPAAGKAAGEVILTSPTARFMTAMFSDQPLTLKARAVATYNSAATACVLALNPTAPKAALFSGNTNVGLTGCSVMSNSTAIDSILSQGSAVLRVDCLISAGGVSLNSGVTLNKCDTPVTHAPAVGDPFKTLATPVSSGPCRSTRGATLQPGNYCSGLSLSGTVNLASGVYIITGGDLKINANANVTGTGVTFYLASGSHVSFNGNSTMQLSAPTTGAYAGVLMMGSRSSTGGKNIVNGNATSMLTGALYFPKEELDYLGNFSGQGGCTQVVADTIQWSGSTTISADCSSLGMTPIPAMAIVRLVE